MAGRRKAPMVLLCTATKSKNETRQFYKSFSHCSPLKLSLFGSGSSWSYLTIQIMLNFLSIMNIKGMNIAKKWDQTFLEICWSVFAIEAQPFRFRLKLKCACSLSCFPLKLPAGQKIRLLCMLQGKKDMSPI